MSILPNNLFNKYKAVNSLYASGMDLQKLPAETFLNASNMLDMNLSYNKLEKLEEKVFTPCEHLKKLVLNNNQIAEIDVDAFDKLYNLEELDLSHNKLTFVPHKALAQLSKLKTLKLTNNTFVVRYGQFPDTLVTLDLSYNDLESFSLKSIISLTKLKYLFLNGNKIFRFRQHIFPDGIFDVLKSLKYIQLSDNGFFCTTLGNIHAQFSHIFDVSVILISLITADIFIWLEKYKVKVDVVPHLMILNSSNIHGVGCKEETRQLL